MTSTIVAATFVEVHALHYSDVTALLRQRAQREKAELAKGNVSYFSRRGPSTAANTAPSSAQGEPPPRPPSLSVPGNDSSRDSADGTIAPARGNCDFGSLPPRATTAAPEEPVCSSAALGTAQQPQPQQPQQP